MSLAINAQTLTFSYTADEKLFQVVALKGNQIIMYDGVTPNSSSIIKKWLSMQLDVNEQNVLEGFLDKPK